MLLISDLFKTFVEWVISLNLISSDELELSLNDLGGISGVIEDDLYISAYEEIGRCLAKKLSYDALCELFDQNSERFSENPEQLYYFIEAVVDEVSARGESVNPLITLCPEQYQVFLLKRFG